MTNLEPPAPQIKDGKNGASWLSRGFILDFRGMEFTAPFYSVLDCSCKECENRLIWFCQSAFLKSK